MSKREIMEYDVVVVGAGPSGLSAAIKLKQLCKDKNRDLDRWRTSVRMPFESVFSKMKRETRYRGVKKVQFQNLMECLVYNFKKLIKYRSFARAS